MRIGIVVLTASLVVLPLFAFQRGGAPAPEPPEQTTEGGPFAPFEDLLGSWRGIGKGKLGDEHVERQFYVVLGGAFLQSQTRTVAKRSIHEDLGMLSFDKSRGLFVMREFQSEGVYNQYTIELQDGGETIVMTTEAIENPVAPGVRLRQTLKFVGEDELLDTLEVKVGDEPWELSIESTLKRSPD